MRWRRTKHKVRRRQAAHALLADLPRGRVLDAPCGEAVLARELAARGHEVWACDLDPRAPASTDGLRFDVVDLDGPLPYPDAFFDAVVSLEGLEHLLRPAACLAEFARVLKPGGTLVFSTPNINSVQSRYHYFFTGRFSGFKTLLRRGLERPAGPVHWHVTLPYLPTFAHVLARRGLRLERVEVTMIKTRQWLFLPLALLMWLAARRAPPGSLTRLLGSWRFLLGRSVIVRAVKPA